MNRMKQQIISSGEWSHLFEPDQFVVNELEQSILNYDAYRNRRGKEGIQTLLNLRKELLNHYALLHQKELLPDIIAFNDCLKESLRKMYVKTVRIWHNLKMSGLYNCSCWIEARCDLDWEYPVLHPVQTENRKKLWEILCDTSYNKMYSSGVTIGTLIINSIDDAEKNSIGDADKKSINEVNEKLPCNSFESFIGLMSSPPNWNEGLDPELTKDLHLISPFHHLFEHTCFALTDFLYVRRFTHNFKVESEDEDGHPTGR